MDRMLEVADVADTHANSMESLRPASEDAISRIAVRVLEQNEGEITCIICLETIHPGSNVVALSCHSDHIFHELCIHQQLRGDGRCPNCRQRIPED